MQVLSERNDPVFQATWQEVMAKIYTHRSSAASGELRWLEGSRPGRSKDFSSHQFFNWVLVSKDGTESMGRVCTGTSFSTSSPVEIFHQAGGVLLLPCWDEAPWTGLNSAPSAVHIASRDHTAAGASVGFQRNE